MTRFAIVFAGALSVAGCSGAHGGDAWTRPGLGGAVRPEMGQPQPGSDAPDFVLPSRDGSALRLSSLHGSWVLLHFTAGTGLREVARHLHLAQKTVNTHLQKIRTKLGVHSTLEAVALARSQLGHRPHLTSATNVLTRR